MKKLLFLGACLVALTSQPVMAQTGGPDVIVMSVRMGGLGKTRVVLAYSGGKTEEKMIKNASNSDKAQDEAAAAYQEIIAGLYQQGYSLKSTFVEFQGSVSTLVFVKGQ
ncbi:hypothetical protein FNT36_18435 [Hymenobacter setariae]|uniref:DUF4907 domain-containing protein n=1 Tax=Hymenobacter setariae TaxID=2594794 RepID=A0A558BSW9_9BACT|nr:hypothetical protein [Hymenobacter setariae]TVT39620.1 hypothetical protein FNT36_18435 [Hymenobacter setariae]